MCGATGWWRFVHARDERTAESPASSLCLQLLRGQYLYFCTSKASKLRSKLSTCVCRCRGALRSAAQALCGVWLCRLWRLPFPLSYQCAFNDKCDTCSLFSLSRSLSLYLPLAGSQHRQAQVATHTHTHTNTHTHTHTRAHTHAHKHAHTHTRTRTHTHACRWRGRSTAGRTRS